MAPGYLSTCCVAIWLSVTFLFTLEYVMTDEVSSETKVHDDEEEDDTFENKAVIVLASSFPAGLLVGGLWCYCMSAVCKTRKADYKQIRLSAPTQQHRYIQHRYPQIQRHSTQYSLDSPTSSDISTLSPSPLP